MCNSQKLEGWYTHMRKDVEGCVAKVTISCTGCREVRKSGVVGAMEYICVFGISEEVITFVLLAGETSFLT